jgi:hypothetical protein
MGGYVRRDLELARDEDAAALVDSEHAFVETPVTQLAQRQPVRRMIVPTLAPRLDMSRFDNKSSGSCAPAVSSGRYAIDCGPVASSSMFSVPGVGINRQKPASFLR